MIRFDHVTFTYAGNADPTLRDVDLDLRDGELALVIGPTGSGKSTLLKAMNGLVPHFTGGTLAGAVTVGGRSTRDYPPRQLAETVGYVIQDPVRGFVTDTVEAELAWTMEQLGVEPAVMRRRVEDMFDLLGLAELRDRPLATLSAGQAQRVAIGAALTPMPQALVLDEPTSALDPAAAEEVLAAITRLVHDLGLTVVMAEHRLERAVQFADRILEVGADGRVRAGRPEAILAGAPLAPPVVELGRVAGWRPLPLTVRDARRRVPELADRLPVAPPARFGGEAAAGPAEPDGPVVLRARGVTVRYGRVLAVDGVDLDLVAGRVTALMGRNGSGKSSLLWALHGAGESESGEITHWPGGNAPIAPPSEGGGWSGRAAAQAKHRHWPFRARGRRARPGATPTRAATVGLVPSQPGDLLSLGTVAAEYEAADRRAAAPPGPAAPQLGPHPPRGPPGRPPPHHPEG
ncbi:MAG: ATP-binding cassette domain-containing protein, partial [Bifidobacteriaceae bacterium]|nr:ATP-binding cassette domain-containing protein [Bifidobacteriaceae bacterium]